MGGYAQSANHSNTAARASFNNTVLELINSDQDVNLVGLSTTNLTVTDKTIKVTERNTYYRSVLDEGDHTEAGTLTQSLKLVPAGTGTVQLKGTVTTVTFKLSHDAVPFSAFSSATYGTGKAFFDKHIGVREHEIYTDGVNGANKFWSDFGRYGFTEFSNDDLFRMSVRLPNVGKVTVEHQIIDDIGIVIGTLAEESTVKENETVGTAYVTQPLVGDKLLKDGKTYEYVKVAPTSAPANGEVKAETQHVIYQYREVKTGGEVVEKHVIQGTDKELVTADGSATVATVKEAGSAIDEAYETQPKPGYLYDNKGNAYKSNGDTDGKDNNATGTVTAGKQTVTFEYVPVIGNVVVDYVDEAGNPIPGVAPKNVKENAPVNKNGNPYDTTTEDFRPKTVTSTDGIEYELVKEEPKDGSATPTGNVEEGTKTVTYVYRKVVTSTPETPKGSVTVEHQIVDKDGTVIGSLQGTTPVVTAQEVGTGYNTSALEGDKLVKDGKTYEFVKISDTSAPANGQVAEGTQHVVYQYCEVVSPTPETPKGMVMVHYVDENGKTIASSVTDTPASPVDTDYDTTDNKPSTIEFDGKTYELVPSSTIGAETGKVVKGNTEITYVYRLKETPAKTVVTHHVDEEGNKVADDEEGTEDTKTSSELPGYEYVTTTTDKEGNTTHVYRKVVSVTSTDTPVTPATRNAKVLPRTGETSSNLFALGLAILAAMTGIFFWSKKKGDKN